MIIKHKCPYIRLNLVQIRPNALHFRFFVVYLLFMLIYDCPTVAFAVAIRWLDSISKYGQIG